MNVKELAQAALESKFGVHGAEPSEAAKREFRNAGPVDFHANIAAHVEQSDLFGALAMKANANDPVALGVLLALAGYNPEPAADASLRRRWE